jgi:hypothetical protein
VNQLIYGGLVNSSSLFGLQYLQHLNLASKTFNYSVIPSELGKLTNLSYLNLPNDGLAGHILIAISRLTMLVTIDLSCHYFLETHSLKLENSNLNMLSHNLSKRT